MAKQIDQVYICPVCGSVGTVQWKTPNIIFDDLPFVAKECLIKGACGLASSVAEKVNALLELSKTDNPEFTCDDDRKQALVGILCVAQDMATHPKWVFCYYAKELYDTLLTMASGSDWSTPGLKRYQETLKRWISEGNEND